MITNIWLKSQPKKKLSYPNTFPIFIKTMRTWHIREDIEAENSVAAFTIESVSRIEFRP